MMNPVPVVGVYVPLAVKTCTPIRRPVKPVSVPLAVTPLNVCVAPHVFAPFSNGIVAPLVPVLTVADVPSPRFVRALAALVAPVPPFAIGSVPVGEETDGAPHMGEVLAPVEMIACPAVEPEGLIRDGGVVVAPNARVVSARSAEAMIFFIS
jgi:hypothetical protein